MMDQRCPGLLLILLLLGACGTKRTDLIPVGSGAQGDLAASCSRDATGHLVIRISNRGRARAKATTTVVEFESYWPVSLPTRPMAPGEIAEVQLSVPCRQQCRFEIVVDALDEIQEIDEGNNRLSGVCQ